VKVLITTTINNPTVLTKWAAGLTPEDHIIVAGDQKSPHSDITSLLNGIESDQDVSGTYLHPDDQHVWDVSDVLGWNCIQRRNIALLEAMKLKPEWIITIDDDNYPKRSDQVDALIANMQRPSDIDVVSSSNGWWNPGQVCATRNGCSIIHRGYPVSMRHDAGEIVYDQRPEHIDIAVGAMLWTGEPDIDAIQRMCCSPLVTEIEYDTVVPPGIWAPFNSQATIYRADVVPLMFMLPGVGRYDDIWASYIARRVMDHFNLSVYYGNPAVHQDRNAHNVMTDLSHEIFGMTFNDEFIQALKSTSLEGCTTVIEALDRCFVTIHQIDFMPVQTRASLGLWMADLTKAGVL
jgi:hypothetical protein